MNRIARHIAIIVAVIFVMICVPSDLWSQCPMCRMSAESNLQNGGSAGRGLNAGILYMLAAPYLLIGTIGFLWWRSRKKRG